MIDRLKYNIGAELKKRGDMLLEGYVTDIVTYRIYVAERNVMKWVLEEIDKLENGLDDDDPADTPSVDEI